MRIPKRISRYASLLSKPLDERLAHKMSGSKKLFSHLGTETKVGKKISSAMQNISKRRSKRLGRKQMVSE